jgi:hypothetical protein
VQSLALQTLHCQQEIDCKLLRELYPENKKTNETEIEMEEGCDHHNVMMIHHDEDDRKKTLPYLMP